MTDILLRLRETLTSAPTDEAMWERIVVERRDAANEIDRLRGIIQYLAAVAAHAQDASGA